MRNLGRMACLLLAVANAGCSTGDDPVVAEVVALSREHALYAERVDWPAVEADAQRIARDGRGRDARGRAIDAVLRALGDGHSVYLPPDRVPGAQSSARTSPIATSGSPIDGFGHLIIRAWSGSDEAMPAAAREVRDALARATAHDDCGLVIDVASNGGGNMWPMMAGIAPLYDDGALVIFETRRGERSAVNVQAGVLRLGTMPLPPQDDLPPVARAPRFIALLLGRRTASSGEILALAFRGQANVRSFGTRTRGATTSNSTHRLSNGGLLALTTARLRDRADVVQQGPIVPDVETYEPLDTATRWLRERCGR